MGQYINSEQHLKRAELTIPLGSQTFSKSKTQYPVGVSPLYATKAKGAEIWDLDGNRYVDLVSSLASVTFGYADREIESAVKKQLKNGVTLSLPGKMEAEVAELICELVPSAEMVRYGKNGTDATSAAVRLARAYTGRDHVAVCGYHGWQDWYIGSTTRNRGVPKVVSDLTHPFSYNDIDSFKKLLDSYPNQLAAVIMEPMNSQWPVANFLEKIRELTRNLGIVLIFDETITGFRFAKGGAQELFKVTPDLSTFGKGMANGFPLSAVVGRKDIMMEMENIFFSGTFGGELLSLAAAKVVLKKHLSGNVTEELSRIGRRLSNEVNDVIDELKLGEILNLSGHDTWKFLNWKATEEVKVNELRTLFLQEMFRNKILIIATHNVSLSIGRKHTVRITEAYREALQKIATAVEKGTVAELLQVEPLMPLFNVR